MKGGGPMSIVAICKTSSGLVVPCSEEQPSLAKAIAR